MDMILPQYSFPAVPRRATRQPPSPLDTKDTQALTNTRVVRYQITRAYNLNPSAAHGPAQSIPAQQHSSGSYLALEQQATFERSSAATAEQRVASKADGRRPGHQIEHRPPVCKGAEDGAAVPPVDGGHPIVRRLHQR